MAFDIEATLETMAGAIAGVIADEWPRVQACVRKALRDEQDALVDIAVARLAGEIDDAEMRAHLEDEKKVLRAALLACRVRTKVTQQKAANAAIVALTEAIKGALSLA